ncbi:MAG TPA: hypothetical protein VMI12_03585 [Puia sp.]|nr:hypothetical protein [Puia sp.]
MPTKKKPEAPSEPPSPEIKPVKEPENPVAPEEDPDMIPDKEPVETPPYEIPPPGEGS